MAGRRLPTLESSGRPELAAFEASVQRVFDGLDASSIAYTPRDASLWVSPPPRTLQEALDRQAANIPPVTPIP